MKALSRLRTLWRLGLANLLRVGVYRVLVKTRYYRWRLPIRAALVGPHFTWPVGSHIARHPPSADAAAWLVRADHVLAGQLQAFSHEWRDAGFPPRWQRSLLTQVDAGPPLEHWSVLSDFSLQGGDIKGYWEAGRFDGLLSLVLAWLCSRREDLPAAIEAWLDAWCKCNPANAGLQWKCGQETGIRLMQLLLCVELMRRWAGVQARPAVMQLVAEHCERIAPTMLYAVGQDNNHGTSEAAALYVAGAFLARHGTPAHASCGQRWQQAGRRWMEERCQRLVMADGSFSQHSTNYHRLFLDTCSLAETFRCWYGLPAWSLHTQQRLRAATSWLAGMTDEVSGDAPNTGANDGARLFVLHNLPYRNFRPSVQWAAVLFLEQPAYAPGICDEQLEWLQLTPAQRHEPVTTPALSQLWADGGYAKLAVPGARAFVRLPRYRFRPSHADGLHLDLWLNGLPALLDAGTYSYNTAPCWLGYFSGTESHNTVQFDGRDQMPRLSRFLFGDWLDCTELDFDALLGTVTAAYRDAHGAFHRRRVTLAVGHCSVVDEISGVRERAVLRWRLALTRNAWVCDESGCTDGDLKIAVQSSSPLTRLGLVDGWHSPHYAQRVALKVLEAEVDTSATLRTDITWPQ